jgi:hypothetical protein
MDTLYASLANDPADLLPRWTVLASTQELRETLAQATEWRSSAGPRRFGDRVWVDTAGVLRSSRLGVIDQEPLGRKALRMTPELGVVLSVLASATYTGREWILLLAHSKGVDVFTAVA